LSVELTQPIIPKPRTANAKGSGHAERNNNDDCPMRKGHDLFSPTRLRDRRQGGREGMVRFRQGASFPEMQGMRTS
jgi:hypothetical protein